MLDIDNAARFETYVIKGESGSGVIGINGAAAKLVAPGHKVIIIAYAMVDDREWVGDLYRLPGDPIEPKPLVDGLRAIDCHSSIVAICTGLNEIDKVVRYPSKL